MLIDIFEHIENFFNRLESYTEVPPTAALTDVFVKAMIEVLSILAIATEEINLGRSSEFVDQDLYIALDLLFQKKSRGSYLAGMILRMH